MKFWFFPIYLFDVLVLKRALTPAERARRYRAKLKKNPQKYEEWKKKQLVRSKRIKFSDLSEHEKEKKRKRWREYNKKRSNKYVNKFKILGIWDTQPIT